MTEGHDDIDDRSSAGRRDESRDRDGSGTDGQRPWQGERTVEPPNSGPETDSADPAVTSERRLQDESTAAVSIAEEATGADDWVDLGAYLPSGETLLSGEIPAEKLHEYTTDRRSLNPLVQIRWALRVIVTALVAGLVSVWGLGALNVAPLWSGAVTGALLLVGFVWVVLHYRLWVYQIRADAIYLERGVVTHVQSLVPYVRVQHVDTSRSPVERLLGLSTLVVYTAGSRGADVSIPGLKPTEARDLQRRVKELAIEAEGDDAV
ncbi:membrane protein YdbS, contains bPH2 (pleckstrin homology) domain [Halovenus aranensis]|uniref:Membrane protein YdbS, contains bPH2 (Pleckstrin homology) domain n=1 Tax=Halovenus aranensis TaxID=890420 RepID=A0A1G8THK2_9EURY|nr:PH domain-containing protein [Halovenus aranensis]SDJ40140.1 membrane protein YdbS, contains bPH2 (pleckstrin homology) domain [Halovenus aranensis]